MVLENKLGLTSYADLAREEEKISKAAAVKMFINPLTYNCIAVWFFSFLIFNYSPSPPERAGERVRRGYCRQMPKYLGLSAVQHDG